MHYVALATDYDGTVAHDGVIDPPTLAALQRLRASNRKLILVTGRELEDLIRVLPEIGVFDLVVAENGALLYWPETKRERLLAPAPEPAFVQALRDAGVNPLSVGHAIVATWEPNETKVLAAIRDLGLELQITFNKGAVMVLPAGVTKESGLRAALKELDISPNNTVAVGDAENDFAFFNLCGMPVAVSNALPMLKDQAVLVTEGARGAGVEELIDRLLKTDLAELDSGNARQTVQLAEPLGEGDPLVIVPQRQSLLLAGASGGGKTTLTTGLVERMAARGFQVLLIDPEGDYEDMDEAIVIGSPQDAPDISKVIDLLLKTDSAVAVNLLGVKLPDRPAFFARLLPELLALRARTGRPHFIVVDEAHHMLPESYDPGGDALPAELKGFLFVTVRPEAVSARVMDCLDRMIAVGDEAGAAIRTFCAAVHLDPPDAPDRVERGEMLTLSRTGPLRHLKVIPGSGTRTRHLRKYAEGKLGDDRAFFFRGPGNALNLRATNLVMFIEMGAGVDEATWEHHRKQGDYSTWIGSSIKDQALTQEVAAIEQGDQPFDAARDAVRTAIEARYTLPA